MEWNDDLNTGSSGSIGVGTPQAELPSNDVMMKAKIRQLLNSLFRQYLSMYEETVDDHDDAMRRLMDALPTEYKGHVLLADYLPERKVELFRKRVLNAGNAVIRELETTVDNLGGR